MSRSGSDDLGAIIGPRMRVRSAYQPIVELESRRTIGYEALARFPDAPHLGPSEVFAHARSRGHLDTLDWQCRRSAIMGAIAGGLESPQRLFVNVEPRVIGRTPPWPMDSESVQDVIDKVSLVLELTEHALFEDPSSVLAGVDWARHLSCAIALDDVGANPDSLPMLTLIRPDVIKLDRALLSPGAEVEHARTLRAVWDYVAESGAVILCEGVETDADLARARACGATLAQGYALGRPGPLPPTFDRSSSTVFDLAYRRAPGDDTSLPTDVFERRPGRIAPLWAIELMCNELETRATQFDSPGCVLVASPFGKYFGGPIVRRYARLTDANSLVGVVGLGDELPDGMRGSAVSLDIDDFFALAVINPQYSAALVGRPTESDGPILTRRYEWTLTHDDDDVAYIARSLIRLLAPPRDRSAAIADMMAVTESTEVGRALGEIADLTVGLDIDIDHAGFSLAPHAGGLQTVAASDHYAFLADQVQALYGSGPAFSGDLDSDYLDMDDISTDERWPLFRSALIRTSGIRSMLSIPLFTDGDGIGVITVYSRRPNGFHGETRDAVFAVADHASAVWGRLRGEDQQHRRCPEGIEAALLMVMAREELDRVEAFRLIAARAISAAVPLSRMAEGLVSGEQSPSR